MDNFKSSYLSKCSELCIEPLHTVMNALNNPSRHQTEDDGTAKDPKKVNGYKPSIVEKLDLSGQSIPLKACVALSAALAEDIVFTRLILADAFLGDDGSIALTGALKTNNTVTHLDLRGNSIRADGAIAIGQMLKVNNSIKSLTLEWNCVGIWDSGIRAIADGLSINQCLEHLDLRNNKIGPQGAQLLALCLKHNTHLRKLDLRWNNAGLVGGRAFADLLKWNVMLTDVDLAGNEVPEDILRSISSSLERNRDRYKHEMATRAHSETLNSTLQSLTHAHQESLSQLSRKLANTDQHAQSLSAKLAQASTEIAESQDAYRTLKSKLERITGEKLQLEDLITNERTQQQKQLNDIQKELMAERERRVKAEDAQERITKELKSKLLELEAAIKKLEMENEVLKKDKTYLLDDVSKSKEREGQINDLWQEKVQRIENVHHNKLLMLQDAKDKELAEQAKRFEERIRALETAKTRLEEELDTQKTKNMNDRRHWQQNLAEAEQRIRLEEDNRRKDIHSQIETLTRQRDQLQAELSSHLTQHSHLLKEHEAEVRRLLEHKTQLHEEISQLKAKEAHFVSDTTQLRSRLEDTRTEVKSLSSQVQDSQRELTKERREVERLLQQIQSQTQLISRLKEEIRKKDDELDAREEEQFLKMKELQLSINTLLSSRTRKAANRSKTPDLEHV